MNKASALIGISALVLGGCVKGAGDDASLGEAKSPLDPSQACFVTSQGDPTSCKGPGTWNDYASQDCLAQGASLGAFDLIDPCDGGNFSSITYECCPLVAKKDSCFFASQGDPTSCKDPGTWKERAWQSCLAEGASLIELDLIDPCDGVNFRYSEYECCAP